MGGRRTDKRKKNGREKGKDETKKKRTSKSKALALFLKTDSFNSISNIKVHKQQSHRHRRRLTTVRKRIFSNGFILFLLLLLLLLLLSQMIRSFSFLYHSPFHHWTLLRRKRLSQKRRITCARRCARAQAVRFLNAGFPLIPLPFLSLSFSTLLSMMVYHAKEKRTFLFVIELRFELKGIDWTLLNATALISITWSGRIHVRWEWLELARLFVLSSWIFSLITNEGQNATVKRRSLTIKWIFSSQGDI